MKVGGVRDCIHLVLVVMGLCGVLGCSGVGSQKHVPFNARLPREEYEKQNTELLKLGEELGGKLSWSDHDWARICPFMFSPDIRLRCRAMEIALKAEGADDGEEEDPKGEDAAAIGHMLGQIASLMDYHEALNSPLFDKRYDKERAAQRKLHVELGQKSAWTPDDWRRLCRYLYSPDFRLRFGALGILLSAKGASFDRYEHLVVPFLSDDSIPVRARTLRLLAEFGSPSVKRFVSCWRYSRDGLEAETVEALPDPVAAKKDRFSPPAPPSPPELEAPSGGG